MNDFKVKLGVAPTRRELFSREDAIKYKNLTLDKLRQLNVDFVDLESLNDEGLLYDVADVSKVVEYFEKNEVDAIFVPHCNFGTEEAVAMLAKKLGKPVLLWGPRDESPLADGTRLRDSQCGLFATSKVLSRFGVPFTYIENCRLDDQVLERELENFIAAACVVKNFKGMKIGQIGTRPQSFLSVISDEGDLLSKFGIQVEPITVIELTNAANRILINNKNDLEKELIEVKSRIKCEDNEAMFKILALKKAMKEWAAKSELSAIAIQCWSSLQDIYGVMPCFANSELTSEGLPVVCETDICGAVSAVLAQAAVLGKTPTFFADLTVRHPKNDNAELLWHCGPFPYKLKADGCDAEIGSHSVLKSHCYGVNEWEIRGGEISICRFDGINGVYSMLIAAGKGVDGPKTRGSYVWVEFENWAALERKIIEGPYIHHVAGVHKNIIPVIKEALKYLPKINMDIC